MRRAAIIAVLGLAGVLTVVITLHGTDTRIDTDTVASADTGTDPRARARTDTADDVDLRAGSETDDVWLQFDGSSGGEAPVDVASTAAAVGDVVSDGGSIRQVAGPPGYGSAVEFPASGEPAAVIIVRNSGSTDRLEPGDRDFAFGADVRVSAGNDDGDNVLQRGLWGDDGQYKLQVDYGVVSCTVQGASGRVLVRIDEIVEPLVWYRLVCQRSGDDLSLEVERLDTGATWREAATGPIGSVRMSSADSPLSIGGKVGWNGEIVKGPDQFNGAIDNVYVRID